MDVGNLIPGSSAFLKTSLNIWKFVVHELLKAGLENFEHYFASAWDEYNCVVAWVFFGIAFLRDWNENWPFSPVGTAEFSKFAGILSSALSQHHLSGLNSSTGIPSPPLALFIVTSHSRMSGFRWLITPSWLSGSWRCFLYSSSVCILATSS